MLPVYERDIFKEVKSGVLEGRSYIIYGLYQSRKMTFLLHLKEIFFDNSLNYVFFWMPSKILILKIPTGQNPDTQNPEIQNPDRFKIPTGTKS